MKNIISGTITTIFGDDVNTDDIIPAWTLQESDKKAYFAEHAFEKFDKEFVSRCKTEKSNIVIAGANFGCGSSREQAVYALQNNNVAMVIAKSYPDIFYRNSVNNGLVLITVTDVEAFKLAEKITVDLEKRERFALPIKLLNLLCPRKTWKCSRWVGLSVGCVRI